MSHGTTELDRPVPLYMQVARQLRAQIAAGELRDGDRLPSQREMMARWRISMQTASKVIGAMKTEGLAVPSVGRDTIVAPGAAARIAAAAQGTACAPAASLPPAPGAAVTAVTAGKAAAPGPVAEILGIPPGRRALRRTETREDNGQPASLTVAWYPPDIADPRPAWPTASRCPPEPWPTSPRPPGPAHPAPTRTTPPSPPTTTPPPRSASAPHHRSSSPASGTTRPTASSSSTPKPPCPAGAPTAAATASPATDRSNPPVTRSLAMSA